jgi:hypothetical protein
MENLNPQLHIKLITEYIKYLDDIDKAIEHYKQLKFDNWEMPLIKNLYEILIEAAINKEIHELINDLHDSSKSKKIKLSENILINLMKINIKNKNYSKSLEIIEIIPTKILFSLGIDILNNVLEVFIEIKLYRKVFSLYETLKRKSEDSNSKLKPNTHTICLIIKALTLAGREKEAKQMYIKTKETSQLDIGEYNLIAEAFVNMNDNETANLIINDIIQSGLTKDVDTEAVLIKIYSNILNEEKCIAMLDELLKNNIKPNLSIYFSLMNLFIKKKKINQAIGIYIDIKLNKLIDENILNTIIYACLENQKIENAIEILIDGAKNDIYLSAEVYKTFLDTLIKNSEMKIIDKTKYVEILVRLMRDNQIEINSDIKDKINKICKFPMINLDN